MKYEKIRDFEETKFRRITGVKRATFVKMAEILTIAENIKRSKGGPKPSLTVEDMLLATLEYLREYRTYAHIGASFGLCESRIYRIIKWVEDTLIKDGTFSLPGKKELVKEETEIDTLLIDATETPIERPKKDKGIGIQERKNGIL